MSSAIVTGDRAVEKIRDRRTLIAGYRHRNPHRNDNKNVLLTRSWWLRGGARHIEPGPADMAACCNFRYLQLREIFLNRMNAVLHLIHSLTQWNIHRRNSDGTVNPTLFIAERKHVTPENHRFTAKCEEENALHFLMSAMK